MKFINYLEKITGVGIFPLISLLVFFTFFVVVTYWAFQADKGYINLMKRMPINEND